jgi:murein DD-endopeptidase MepM/ murein hydrolase activator NlpD
MSSETIVKLSRKVEKLNPVIKKTITNNQRFIKKFLQSENENNRELRDILSSIGNNSSKSSKNGEVSPDMIQAVQDLQNQNLYQQSIIKTLSQKIEDLQEENNLATKFLSKLDKKTILAALGGGAVLGTMGSVLGSVSPGMEAEGGAKASPYITSGYGYQEWRGREHKGIDVAGGPWQSGAPISVIKPGKVIVSTGDGGSGWGNHVVIQHDDGTYSLYGHMNSLNVKNGDKIENKSGSATVIGTVGSTGRVTGPHLHFELGSGWKGVITGHMNPTSYIDSYVRAGGKVKTKATPSQLTTSVNKTDPSSLKSEYKTKESKEISMIQSPSGKNQMIPISSNSDQSSSQKSTDFLSILQFNSVV